MKIKKNLSLFISLLTFSLLTFSSSCSERNETVNCFPNSVIDVSTNLNLQPYINDLQQKGWCEINEQQCGTRGLILVKNGNNNPYVFDKNAPHICPDENTTLEVRDNTYIYCPKDGATWILRDGTPSAIANIPPKRYYVSFYNSATGQISITN